MYMSNTTRISDLPENVKMQVNEQMNSSYSLMNVHPNPYGNDLQPNTIPLPQDTQTQKNSVYPQLTQEQMQMINHSEQSFPSRDIPMDETIYQDIATTPNYIPPPKNKEDYISEYERASREHFANQAKEKYRETTMDIIFSEIQMPLFIGTLFFIFQLPLMNSFFSKYFYFLSIHHNDGHLNFFGILLKTFLFCSIFYSLNKTINYLSII